MRRIARIRGFTLVELLVVLGLLSAFTYLAFRLLSGGLAIWRIADESRDQDQRAQVILDFLRRDLAVADGSARSRFVVDHSEYTVSRESHGQVRLRFVRTLNRADEARARQGFAAPSVLTSRRDGAATVVDTEAGAPVPPATGTGLDAPRRSVGLLEVAYAAVPDASRKENDGAVQVLRRGTVLFDPDNPGQSVFARDYFERAKGGFLDRSGELAGGVLHFGLLLASGDTMSFTGPAGAGGPETAWDSTRFEFSNVKAEGKGRFTFASPVALPARERVFPRRVQVTLVLEREDPDRRRLRLARALDATAMEIRIDDPRPIGVKADELVKIGGEWIQLQGAEPGVLRARARGALGTRPVPHDAGHVVHRGRLYTAEFPLDCARDAFSR